MPNGLIVRAYDRAALKVPECDTARGPTAEGATGTGDYAALFAQAWALLLGASGNLSLVTLAGGQWAQVAPLSPLPVLPLTARHVTMAFDQAARPVIAWESEGLIYLRHWGALGGAFETLTFAGVDPVLTTDALANGDTPTSDVLLAHLNTTRDSLLLRVQREAYATARATAIPPNSVLDAAVSRALRVQFVGADAGGTQWAVSSDLYPYIAVDALCSVTASAPAAGTYGPVVLVTSLGTGSLAALAAFAPVAGIYETIPTEITRNVGTQNLTTTTATPPATGSYDAAVTSTALSTQNLTTTTATPPATGSYSAVVLVVALQNDSLSTAAVSQPTGGIYAP